MDPAHLQSAVFLQLVVGGHLMLFVTRSRGAFWRAPYPAWPLFGAIVVTQILAVLMTGFGWLVPQLPWRDIGWIWVYNLAWMVVLDLAKLGSNRLMEHRAGLKQRFLAHANRSLHRLETRR
jgi:H+-transporting ATPase